VQESSEPEKLSTKQVAIIIAIPLLVSLLFAIVHNYIATRTFYSFIAYGIASVISNLLITTVNFIRNRHEIEKQLGNNFLSIPYILSLMIPFAVFYCLFSIPFVGQAIDLSGFIAPILIVIAMSAALYTRTKPREVRDKIQTRFFQFYGRLCGVWLFMMLLWLIILVISIVCYK
jgi:hypothetical protein